MTNKDLRELLENLHQELKKLDTLDETRRGLLREISEDIQKLLDKSGAISPQDDAPALKRMKGAIERLEVEHPTLTMALSELMSILSTSGI